MMGTVVLVNGQRQNSSDCVLRDQEKGQVETPANTSSMPKESERKKLTDVRLLARTRLRIKQRDKRAGISRDRTQMERPPRPTLLDVQGVSMTRYFTDNWDNVQNVRARPDDVLIASYPKAGNTWVSYILDLLYFSRMSPGSQDSVPLYERVPFLELAVPGFPLGVDELNTLTTSPRIIKTHLQVQFIPKSFWEMNSKVIYVARNAKDTAVSYFHFDRMNMVQPEPGDWSSFLQRFMEGKMVFGSWYEHVKGWWEKKQSGSNILYLFYEDLIEDTEREVGRLCSFLGLSAAAELTQQVTRKALFDNMKRNKMVNGSTNEVFDFNISHFMRKGKVGDWKNHFTVQQSQQFDEDYERKMTDTDLQFRTVL